MKSDIEMFVSVVFSGDKFSKTPLDFVAISVHHRRRHDGRDFYIFLEFANMKQRFFDLSGFDFQLFAVGNIYPSTSGLDTVGIVGMFVFQGGFFKNFYDLSFDIIFSGFYDSYMYETFWKYSAGNKYGFSV